MASVMEWIQNAKEEIENLGAAEVAAELAGGEVLLLDLREPQETELGIIPGALLTPRGMLEFYADPATKYHIEELRPDRRVIVYCAAGARSALAAKTLKDLGYRDVAHLEGGFGAWQAEGHEVVTGEGDPR